MHLEVNRLVFAFIQQILSPHFLTTSTSAALKFASLAPSWIDARTERPTSCNLVSYALWRDVISSRPIYKSLSRYTFRNWQKYIRPKPVQSCGINVRLFPPFFPRAYHIAVLTSHIMAVCFSSERTVLLTEAILDSLSLPALRDRELQIVTSYESTFEWIWQQSHLFSQWLTGDHGTSFWITGLPGSGKSTLLRYIASNPRTHSSLKQWTGGKNVLLASFYFWESGTAMQRSQEGLLRSLLHQLLVPHPEMIPLIFPTLWADLWSASTVERVRRLAKWELLDLVRGFKSFFIKAPVRPICLLVDGLDGRVRR